MSLSNLTGDAHRLVSILEEQFGPPRRFGASLFWSVSSRQSKEWVLDLWLDLVPDTGPTLSVLETRGRRLRSGAGTERILSAVHEAAARSKAARPGRVNPTLAPR
jgi:hypothetical protein